MGSFYYIIFFLLLVMGFKANSMNLKLYILFLAHGLFIFYSI